MPQFRAKPITIDAIHVTDSAFEEVRAFAGAAFIEHGHDGYPALRVGDGWEQTIQFGDWVTRQGDRYRIVSTRDLNEFFEPVDDQP